MPISRFAGGSWNGPFDPATGAFAYVAIPESYPVRPGLERPYVSLEPVLAKFGFRIPPQLASRRMHLDPDFQHLTYGDQGTRAKQIRDKLAPGDLLVFYAALQNIHDLKSTLTYAVIGLLVIERFALARDLAPGAPDINAHTRRVLAPDSEDLVVLGHPELSGRLTKCLDVGELRDGAYRVRPDLIETWGGLRVKDGYLQRSARLPQFVDAPRFYSWLLHQGREIVQKNN